MYNSYVDQFQFVLKLLFFLKIDDKGLNTTVRKENIKTIYSLCIWYTYSSTSIASCLVRLKQSTIYNIPDVTNVHLLIQHECITEHVSKRCFILSM